MLFVSTPADIAPNVPQVAVVQAPPPVKESVGTTESAALSFVTEIVKVDAPAPAFTLGEGGETLTTGSGMVIAAPPEALETPVAFTVSAIIWAVDTVAGGV